MAGNDPGGGQQAELGELLAGAVRAVVDAQDVLDDHARSEAVAFAAEPAGSLALPPLWFAFDAVSIDIQLSSEVVRRTAADGSLASKLVCRTVNPFTAGVYGFSAATGTRVRLTLAPQRIVPTTVPVVPAAGEQPSPTT
jgi:hypothetical protein